MNTLDFIINKINNDMKFYLNDEFIGSLTFGIYSGIASLHFIQVNPKFRGRGFVIFFSMNLQTFLLIKKLKL